ncbi:hypothetical protein, partial [Micromonospora sp. NPDC005197]|uniref:hypothetical protein n=1 Tax=Micromonospora sp. NPDC005197 TaxID=3157020 RepID=UPI0033B119BC
MSSRPEQAVSRIADIALIDAAVPTMICAAGRRIPAGTSIRPSVGGLSDWRCGERRFMEIRVLGPVEVWADGRLVDAGAAR